MYWFVWKGCYFFINHQMLQSKNGRNIVGNIPADRILLEGATPFSKGLNENIQLLLMMRYIST